jgi:hypothetical protein
MIAVNLTAKDIVANVLACQGDMRAKLVPAG